MENIHTSKKAKARISSSAIQKLYISMRHLLIRGHYKPLGISGESMIESLLSLKPEIYGSIADPDRVELNGLLYIFQRLPIGIEECRFIKLISREGYEKSSFEPIVPAKRRRNCFRIDEHQMYIEMTRGRSDIYDLLTHLTFMYVESEKIRRHSLDFKKKKKRDWKKLEEIVHLIKKGESYDFEQACTYLSVIIGRTYAETLEACRIFENTAKVNSLFEIVYWLGRLSIDEYTAGKDREISFSSSLTEVLGHHIYGEQWAIRIKKFIVAQNLTDRPIHIISANLHSVMNCLYAQKAIGKKVKYKNFEDLMSKVSQTKNGKLRQTIKKFALQNGMHELDDESGTNITVQIFECDKIDTTRLMKDFGWEKSAKTVNNNHVFIVMDYAFGEQAYETMDELLKPIQVNDKKKSLNIKSINIMGKAGILTGDKSDIMIPQAHIFEGTADNYPFKNEFTKKDFEGHGLGVYEGLMVTVLGTSLQNKDILTYFHRSSWKGVGLEMEGAHYQKAIQSASKIRKHIDKNIKLRYAYYASDNPLETGSTLASGGLGQDGIKPTYLITSRILQDVLS